MNEMYITKNTIVRQAMKALDITAKKLLLVVDENDCLLGTISDGDIRRFLLSNGNLNESIENCYNKNPKYVFVYEQNNIEKIKRILIEKKITILPVLDEHKNIVKLIEWENIFDSNDKPNSNTKKIDVPVVIMAGGKGTRMEPFTSVLPKPLIPVGDKTMLEYIIDEYRKYKIDDYYITVNFKGNMIKAYFDSIEKGYNLKYLEEKDFFGTAGSLKLLNPVPQTFIVSNCDIIVRADLNSVLEFHNKTNSILTILSSIQHHAIPYGVVDFENGGRVTKIKEKPEFSIPVNTGVYILNKKAWSYIPKNEFFHMTHLIEALINDGQNVMTYPVNENDYIDIGQWDEYKDSLLKLRI